MSANLLETRALSVGYSAGCPVLEGLNLTVHPGAVVALIGANGSGKSTLLRTVCGELVPLSGAVEICGQNPRTSSRRQMARALALVTSQSALSVAPLTVRETVSIGRQPYTGLWGRLDAEDRRAVERAMEETGIAAKAVSAMDRLSDGERQKAFIARALAQETPLLVMDEPTNFLDLAARLEIMKLLRELVERNPRRSVLISTHDAAAALRVATDVWVVDAREHTILSAPIARATDILQIPFRDRGVAFDPARNDFIAI